MNAPVDFNPGLRVLQLRVRLCMARRGIRSVAELHRRLIAAGIEISHPQLIRVVDNKAKHWSVPLLNGLLQVLDCSAADLIGDSPDSSPSTS